MSAIALTIAGSDSSGGAGIQADLKAFSALGAYGASVITALTAQNTRGVQGIHGIPADFIRAQMDSVFSDLKVDAVKIGMLGTPEVIEAVAAGLAHWQPRHIVLDPVMVAKSGDKLLADDAVDALRTRLLPLATVITPNLPEAAVLLEVDSAADRDAMQAQADALHACAATAVLLKGGHLAGADSSDFFMADGVSQWLPGERVTTANTHGTGCTLSSAIAALLARGLPLVEAVAGAKAYVAAAIAAADQLEIGSGHGPVHHFHAIWSGERS